MKKAFLTTLLILSVFLSLSAQNDVLPNLMTKGTNMGSLGIGLPAIGGGYSMTIPPISAFYEVGILDFGRPGSVAVGAHAGFWDTGTKPPLEITMLLTVISTHWLACAVPTTLPFWKTGKYTEAPYWVLSWNLTVTKTI